MADNANSPTRNKRYTSAIQIRTQPDNPTPLQREKDQAQYSALVRMPYNGLQEAKDNPFRSVRDSYTAADEQEKRGILRTRRDRIMKAHDAAGYNRHTNQSLIGKY